MNLEGSTSKIATGSDGDTFREQAFVDYDGHLIVLYEFKQLSSAKNTFY